MRDHADHAIAAQAEDGEGIGVVAAVHHEILIHTIDDAGYLRQIGAGLFYAHDVIYLAQLDGRFCRQVGNSAGRHIIDNAGQLG